MSKIVGWFASFHRWTNSLSLPNQSVVYRRCWCWPYCDSPISFGRKLCVVHCHCWSWTLLHDPFFSDFGSKLTITKSNLLELSILIRLMILNFRYWRRLQYDVTKICKIQWIINSKWDVQVIHWTNCSSNDDEFTNANQMNGSFEPFAKHCYRLTLSATIIPLFSSPLCLFINFI